MIEYLKEHKFTGCFVRVSAEGGRVRLSAGATLTPEQALELVTSVLAAREIIVALPSDLERLVESSFGKAEAYREAALISERLQRQAEQERDEWKAAFGVEPLESPEVAREYVRALVEAASISESENSQEPSS